MPCLRYSWKTSFLLGMMSSMRSATGPGHPAAVGAAAVLRPAALVLRPQAVQHEGVGPAAARVALRIVAVASAVGAVGRAPGQRQHVVVEDAGLVAVAAIGGAARRSAHRAARASGTAALVASANGSEQRCNSGDMQFSSGYPVRRVSARRELVRRHHIGLQSCRQAHLPITPQGHPGCGPSCGRPCGRRRGCTFRWASGCGRRRGRSRPAGCPCPARP